MFRTWVHYVIPNIWLQRTGEVAAVSTNVELRDKKNAHLLIVGEQLFQPYTYVSVTLYLHFHVVNPTSMELIAVALLAVVFVAFSCASPTVQTESTRAQGGYVESAQCKVPRLSAKHFGSSFDRLIFCALLFFFQDTNVCTYRFTATQQFFQGDLLQNYTLSAAVRVDCYSGKQRIS